MLNHRLVIGGMRGSMILATIKSCLAWAIAKLSLIWDFILDLFLGMVPTAFGVFISALLLYEPLADSRNAKQALIVWLNAHGLIVEASGLLISVCCYYLIYPTITLSRIYYSGHKHRRSTISVATLAFLVLATSTVYCCYLYDHRGQAKGVLAAGSLYWGVFSISAAISAAFALEFLLGLYRIADEKKALGILMQPV